YYLAPIGEVIKLALPPIDREAVLAVEEPTLFSTAKGLSQRHVQWVVATDAVEESIKSRVLAFVRAHGAIPMSRLGEQFGGARASVKRLVEQGLMRIEEREAERDAFFQEELPRDAPFDPTEPQREAIEKISAALGGEATTFLLHGVTGSGKTEVYLRAIA